MKKFLLYQLLFILMLTNVWADAPFFPKLVVTGSSLLHKPADQVMLAIAVLTRSDEAKNALSDNNVKMQQVIESLQKAGLQKGEYFTGQFSIQPVYSIPPRNPPPDWKAAIVAYEVTNSVNIKTQKLELAPIIIDAVGRAGANQISNISFGLVDQQTHKNEAIQQATNNALDDAQALADAANLKLVRVLDIKLEQPQIYPKPTANMYYMAKTESAPIIEAPDVDVGASVSVTFEISTK